MHTYTLSTRNQWRCFYCDIKVKRKDDGSVLSEPRWAAEAFAIISKKATLKDGLLEGRWDQAGEPYWATDNQWKGLLSYVFLFFFIEPMLLAKSCQQHKELNVHEKHFLL